jgi:hypothetical protein
MKSVNCSIPGYERITCSKIENISYNLIFTTKFNDSSVLITIIVQTSIKFKSYLNPRCKLIPCTFQVNLSVN